MQRIPEPELMDEVEQAAAYANADFEEPHNHFMELLHTACAEALPARGRALDLGCGAADISIRFARAFPSYVIDAVDGAEAMLQEAQTALQKNDAGLRARIRLQQSSLQDFVPPQTGYELFFSNSLLHHLHDPAVLWRFIKQYQGQAQIFIMDLMRPDTVESVDALVQQYASKEPEVLRRDFRNSLLAAFTPMEVEQQLDTSGLTHLQVEVVSDRHLVIRTE